MDSRIERGNTVRSLWSVVLDGWYGMISYLCCSLDVLGVAADEGGLLLLVGHGWYVVGNLVELGGLSRLLD